VIFEALAIDAALTKAANMRSKLEILGDVAALQKSQDWYVGQVSEIESRYV